MFQRGGKPADAMPWVVSYAGFMIIHELGHAFAARRYGAQHISISLDFLVGYASFVPPPGLSRGRRAVISVAGPAVEIAVGVAILLALGANPFSLDSVSESPLRWAVFFLGPLLGLFNLLPILPLDGGHIVSLGVDSLVPGRGRLWYSYISLAVCVVAIVATLRSNQLRFLAFTFGMLAVMNVMAMGAARRSVTPPASAQSGWAAAALLATSGEPGAARRTVVDALSTPGSTLGPIDISHADVDRVLTLVADPAPVESAEAGEGFHLALHHLGYLRRAADYGARLHQRHGRESTALLVAEQLRLLGYEAESKLWLGRGHSTNATSRMMIPPPTPPASWGPPGSSSS